MKIEALAQHVKQRLLRRSKLLLALLFGALVLLLYGTSMLSQATALPDMFVDVAIYTIYLMLVLIIGAMTFIFYSFFEHDPLHETARPLAQEKMLKIDTTPEAKVEIPVVNRPPSSPEAVGVQLEKARDKLIITPLKIRDGYVLIEAFAVDKAVRYLNQQHPQIAAVTVLMLDPKKALDILREMRAGQRKILISRLEQSKPVSHGALMRLERALYKEFFLLQKECTALQQLSNREIQEILRHVNKKELMFALRAVTQELQEKFFANMSSKASGEFKKVMASLSGSDLTKSQNAVKNLYLLAEQLRDDGRIRAI